MMSVRSKVMMGLVAVLSVWGFNARAAQYTCQDIRELQQTLRDLQQSCGVGGGGTRPGQAFCRAKGYIGATVEEAISRCSGAGTPYSREACGADLTCSPGVAYCRAKGYAGSTWRDAVERCAGSGTPFSRQTCETDLTCSGRVHFCRAKGYIGDTVEEAVNKCAGSGTPFSRQTCEADLTCS